MRSVFFEIRIILTFLEALHVEFQFIIVLILGFLYWLHLIIWRLNFRVNFIFIWQNIAHRYISSMLWLCNFLFFYINLFEIKIVATKWNISYSSIFFGYKISVCIHNINIFIWLSCFFKFTIIWFILSWIVRLDQIVFRRNYFRTIIESSSLPLVLNLCIWYTQFILLAR